jgi:hypothetical protein
VNTLSLTSKGSRNPSFTGNLSKSALAAFRTITNLSRRTGKGFVRCFTTLAGLFGICERRAWEVVAELKAAGLIGWEVVRRTGERGIAFWPLMSLPKTSKGRFAPRPEGLSFGSKPAPSDAPLKAKTCTLNGPSPYKTTPVGKETTTAPTQPETVLEEPSAAVLMLLEICPEPEAKELAREAQAQKLTEEQIRRVLDAYRAQASNIRSRGAWLREALRRGFSPPAPPASHRSEVSPVEAVRPVRVRVDAPAPAVAPPVAFVPGKGREFLAALRARSAGSE